MSERVLVRKIEDKLWQWREVNTLGEWVDNAIHTGDINLLQETVKGRWVSLILPGQKIVSKRLVADIKDRNQLIKILPFEIEDNVVDPIENMHFHYGPVENGMIALAYGKLDWISECIHEIEDLECEVIQCSADYLQLPRSEGEELSWTLLFENGQLTALIAKDEGFVIEKGMATLFLEAAATRAIPKKVELFAENEDALIELKSLLPNSVIDSEDLQLEERIADYWGLLSPSQALRGNFRTGRLARKLPFAKWWDDYRIPIIGAAAAFLLAIGATWLGQQKADEQRKTIFAQTDEIFRQVVPSGKINDPHRQLRGMLGKSTSSGDGTSNAVHLIASVGPAIGAIGSVSVKSFRYSGSKKQLQMNVEGNSYQDFESLRKKITDVGFEVEIKSQSAHGDVFQAQLRVSEAS